MFYVFSSLMFDQNIKLSHFTNLIYLHNIEKLNLCNNLQIQDEPHIFYNKFEVK